MAQGKDLNSQQYDLRLLAACGEDTFISQMVEIRRPNLVRIGSHVAIDWGFYCTTQLTVGDYVHIAPYVTCIGGAAGQFSVGNFATVAAGCRIICGSDGHLGAGLVGPTIPEPYRDTLTSAPVVLEPFASLGTNVVVMPGVTLAEGSVVGACSLVTKNTEPWTIYVGTPAKPVRLRPSETMKRMARELGYAY